MPYGKPEIGLVRPAPGEIDAQVIDVWREGQLAGREAETYQGIPPVKKAPWKWSYIPTYFWVGGIAAGSWLAATAEDLVGENDRGVVRAGRYVTLGSILAGTGLLVADLGRSERFHHMLRIIRPRSPMSLGSWVLATFGAFTGAAGILQAAEDGLFGRRAGLTRLSRGPFGRAVHVAGLPPALFVGAYTGTLVAATSTPSWAKRTLLLGPLFMASATSTGLAAVSTALEATNGARPAALTRLSRAEAAALVGELTLAAADRAVARTLPSAQHEPRAATLARWGAIGAGMAAPLVIKLLGGVRRRPREGRRGRSRAGLLGAGLTLAGGYLLRLLVVDEGKRSADTPQDTWIFAGRRR